MIKQLSTILPIYKPLGWTPLQALDQLRQIYPEYHDQKMSYAGRLDPMAEGVLLVVIGDQSKKESLLVLDKTYRFTFLCGITTDTYDVMGKVTSHFTSQKWSNIEEKIQRIAQTFQGIRTQEYPPFSSKTVKGTSLFEYAKTGRLNEIQMPTREVQIYTLTLEYRSMVSLSSCISPILNIIAQVDGDFRQQEIIELWRSYIEKYTQMHYPFISGSLTCSSGTYVRGLVHSIAEELSTGAVVTHILRERVGHWSTTDCLRVE